MKSLKKQLMAAIAMCLVAAVALGSATYAWFANSYVVTADGMTINAQTEGNLLVISDTVAGLEAGETSLTFSPVKVGEDLYPTRPIYAAEGSAVTSWVHRTSDSYNTAISGDDTEAAINPADKDDYYLETSLYIGLDDTNTSASCGAVTVTGVTMTSAGNDLLPCARVLMVVDGKVIGCYGNGTYVSTHVAGTDTGADTTAALPAEGYGTIVDGLTAGGSVKVDLYIYFDGRDGSCTSENFKETDVTVALEFKAAEA